MVGSDDFAVVVDCSVLGFIMLLLWFYGIIL